MIIHSLEYTHVYKFAFCNAHSHWATPPIASYSSHDLRKLVVLPLAFQGPLAWISSMQNDEGKSWCPLLRVDTFFRLAIVFSSRVKLSRGEIQSNSHRSTFAHSSFCLQINGRTPETKVARKRKCCLIRSQKEKTVAVWALPSARWGSKISWKFLKWFEVLVGNPWICLDSYCQIHPTCKRKNMCDLYFVRPSYAWWRTSNISRAEVPNKIQKEEDYLNSTALFRQFLHYGFRLVKNLFMFMKGTLF